MKHGHGSHPAMDLSLILMILALLFSCLVQMPVYADDVTYHETKEEAAAELREAMKERKTSVTIGLAGETDQDGLKQTIGDLIDMAVRHTGKPDEGDYIKFQYSSYKGIAKTAYNGFDPVIEVEYTLTYNDSRDQEDEVDAKAEEILEGLELTDKTEYEKILAIHNYICKNVKYEDEETDNDISHTAYGALIEGRAVCQGYAAALYRLLLEAGIDNRIILGRGVSQEGDEGPHAWNIVKLEGDYYYMDVTWDDSTWSRNYFLRPAGSEFEDSHIADKEFSGESFSEKYSVTDQNYEGEMRSFFSSVKRALERFRDMFRTGTRKLLAND